MAYIEPNTRIDFLSGVPFDPGYENTMYFDDINAQVAYFDTKIRTTVEKSSYQRVSNGVIKVGWVVDTFGLSVINQMYNVNYMRFKNTNFENKWFYAFVDKVEYINNNTVEVIYHLDVIQTWHFDYSFNQCLIEREHTVTDAIGDHTVPEQLETGPYVNQLANYTIGLQNVSDGRLHYTPAVCTVTSFPVVLEGQSGYTSVAGKKVLGLETEGNIFSGCYHTIFSLTTEGVAALNDFISQVTEETALANGLVAVFMTTWDFRESIIADAVSPAKALHFDIRTTVNNNLGYYIGDYRVRNKKLMCYPYNFLYVSNNQGTTQELKWEDFATYLDAMLQVWGNVSANGGMICIPYNYKSVNGRNYDEAMTVTGFQLCSFTYDAYKAWLAQNAGTIGASAATLGFKWAEAVANPASSLMNNMFQVGSDVRQLPGTVENPQANISGGLLASTLFAMGQVFDHMRKPPQLKGNTNMSLSEQAGLITFNFYRKHIKVEYAKIIDSFFDMYGYKTNRVGVPIRDARPCYSFVKTVGCSLNGNLPVSDEKLIENIYNKGIRFWKTTATFGNFNSSVNNNEPAIIG